MKPDDNGELQPWFVASDIAKALGSRDAAAFTRGLDASEKDTVKGMTLGGKQRLIIISEAGLYYCLLRANSPAAKPFQKWVTQTVLPSIRKHSGYIIGLGHLPPAIQSGIMNTVTTQVSNYINSVEENVQRSLRKLDERMCRKMKPWSIEEYQQYGSELYRTKMQHSPLVIDLSVPMGGAYAHLNLTKLV